MSQSWGGGCRLLALPHPIRPDPKAIPGGRIQLLLCCFYSDSFSMGSSGAGVGVGLVGMGG